MAYFRSRVCKLEILRENSCILFDQLKVVVNEFTSDIARLCNQRFAELSSEACGAELCGLIALNRGHSLFRPPLITELYSTKTSTSTTEPPKIPSTVHALAWTDKFHLRLHVSHNAYDFKASFESRPDSSFSGL